MFRGRHWCYGLSACHDTYQNYVNNVKPNGEYSLEHWNAHKECEEKYDPQTERTIEEREIKFSYKSYNFVNHISKHLVSVESKAGQKLFRQQFPGPRDKGTPLVIKEYNRNTIVGIFWFKGELEFNHGNGNFKKGPFLFHRLYDEVVNWIMETADWTHDSKCNAFTSCSCGRPKSLGTKLKFVGHSVFRSDRISSVYIVSNVL